MISGHYRDNDRDNPTPNPKPDAATIRNRYSRLDSMCPLIDILAFTANEYKRDTKNWQIYRKIQANYWTQMLSIKLNTDQSEERAVR